MNMDEDIHLTQKDIDFVQTSGRKKIEEAAYHFVRTKLAPSEPEHDGEQTPKEGHPVFKAQHATGTDSRLSLNESMGIETGRPLTEEEIDRVVDTIMNWISNQLEATGKKQAKIKEF